MREINPSNIRFPEELKKTITESSKENRRSINSEVIVALQAYYSGKSATLSERTDGELIDELVRRYGRDGIFIRIGKEQEGPSAIQEAVRSLDEKLSDIGKAVHAEETTARKRNKNS